MSEDFFICSIKIFDICQITDDIKVSICYSFNYSAIQSFTETELSRKPCAKSWRTYIYRAISRLD